MIAALAEHVAEIFANLDYARVVASITERSTAEELSAGAEELALALAGQAPRVSLFARASAGVVFGFEMEDGRRVVLKWHGPKTKLCELEAQYRVMNAIAEEGIPCPRCIAGPIAHGAGAAALLSWLPAPERAELALERRCATSAAAFAHVIRIARGVEAAKGLPGPELFEDPWPPPHAIVFDFEASKAGAEPIDEIGRRMNAELDRFAGELVAAHGDWTAHNVILDADARLVALYDWDSVNWVRHAVALGAAAVAYALDGRPGGSFAPPEPAYTLAFFDAYERAQGPLSAELRCAATFAAVREFAYLARCQHALATTRGKPPYGFTVALEGYAGTLLRRAS
jgi:Ser/Thr protein kinase RdoA (MazF antagonist)